MKAIINASLVLEDGILFDGAILTDKGRIVSFGPMDETEIPTGAEVYDAQGKYVGPGFVDIHCHGGDGIMFDADPARAAAHFLAHGETTVLATLYYNLSYDEMLAAIRRIREAMRQGSAPAIGGIYMEGPYMNPKYGASPEKNKWRGLINPAEANALIQAAGEDVLVWAVAPEREGVASFVQAAKAANHNVRFAVGHSEATPAQIEALKQYDLLIQTHCTNATAAPCDVGGTRACGPDEACFYDPDMYAEVICDSCGIHVHPDMLRLIHRIKGDDRVILITDSFVSSEQPPENLRHIQDLLFDANGGLSGSKLTMDVACRNMMRHTGIGVSQAFRLASLNPARAVGLDGEVGSIAPGKRANLVLVDDTMHVFNVLLNGEWIGVQRG